MTCGPTSGWFFRCSNGTEAAAARPAPATRGLGLSEHEPVDEFLEIAHLKGLGEITVRAGAVRDWWSPAAVLTVTTTTGVFLSAGGRP